MTSSREMNRVLDSDVRPIRQDGLTSIVEGLATALQCHEDAMGERLASLVREQSALLVKLEAARKALPQQAGGVNDWGPSQADDDVAYISMVMRQVPWYMQRVRALAAKKGILASRVATLQRRSNALRESLPVPVPAALPHVMADELARWRAGLTPFQEQRDMAFTVCYRGGVAIRSAPNVDAPCVGEVLEWDEGFWATERLGRLGEDVIYVRLRDGRGWVFETLNGKKVLERVAPSTLPPPVETSP